MALTYDGIVTFIEDYCEAFSAFAQDPETAERMHAYYAEDVEFVPYTAAALAPISGRDALLEIMTSHPSCRERVTPEDIVVDERRQIAVVRLRAELTDTRTGEVLAEKRYFPLYELGLDANATVKIDRILFWEEVLPPGVPDFGDVFKRDPQMAERFSGHE